MGFFTRSKTAPRSNRSVSVDRCRPILESLESRLVPWAVSGNAWPASSLVTLSFMPDGTDLGGVTSNLFSSMNSRFGTPSVWQAQILKAAQVFAKNTNINFAVVSDNGAALGSGDYQQGDPGFGDIRIGGYNFGTSSLAQAYSAPPINNYSIAGDIQFNTGQVFNIGTTYDLFTTASHEFGHSLGLSHSSIIIATEYATYSGVKTGIDWDDIYGIRNIYSGFLPRSNDWNDTYAPNNSFSTATDVTEHIQGDLTILRLDRDITTTSDVDYFKITAPAGTLSTVQLSAQSGGLSLLAPKITVYASNQTTVLGSSNGLNQYGVTQTVTLNGVVSAGQVIYVKVQGADTTPFGTGKYALSARFGSAPLPTQAPPVTALLNGTPLSGGGGIANANSQELRIAPPEGKSFLLSSETTQAVAMDARGNYVTTWAVEDIRSGDVDIVAAMFDADGSLLSDPFQVNSLSAAVNKYPSVAMAKSGEFVISWAALGADGNNWGILARQFDAAGNPLGDEFVVNTYAIDEQLYPTVAMDGSGNFVITWSSKNQDLSGWGIYARTFNSAGNALLPELRVNGYFIGDQIWSRVAIDANGNYVVTWSSQGQDSSGWGVFAKVFSILGVPRSPEIRVNQYKTGDQQLSSVATDSEGRFVIVWQSENQAASGWDIYGRWFAVNGAGSGSEFLVNSTTTGNQTNPAVGIRQDGDYLVTWTSDTVGGAPKVPSYTGQNYAQAQNIQTISDGQSSGFSVIEGQQYHHGQRAGAEFQVNTTTGGIQAYPSIAMNMMGRVSVVWSIGLGGELGIGGQIYVIGSEDFDAPEGTDTTGKIPYMNNQVASTLTPNLIGNVVEGFSYSNVRPVVVSASESVLRLSRTVMRNSTRSAAMTAAGLDALYDAVETAYLGSEDATRPATLDESLPDDNAIDLIDDTSRISTDADVAIPQSTEDGNEQVLSNEPRSGGKLGAGVAALASLAVGPMQRTRTHKGQDKARRASRSK